MAAAGNLPEPPLDLPFDATLPTELLEVKLSLYRLSVRVEGPPGKFQLTNYWVQAPTQCSAAKHTALRPEIDDITMIELWSKPMPAGATITFTTTRPCP